MRRQGERLLWWSVFLLAASPSCRLIYRTFWGDLGPDPLITLEHGTGFWAFVLLIVTLSITPIRRISGWNGAIKLRKMLGNWSAAYAAAHVTVYVWLDHALNWHEIWTDALEHKRIFLGLLAFLILLALAATSPTFMIRRLGRRWGMIHKLVYAAILLAVVHFALTQKLDWREPLAWGGGVALLLGLRVWWWYRARSLERGAGRVNPAADPGRTAPSS